MLAMAFAMADPEEAHGRYQLLKRKVARKLEQLKQQRQEQLSPSSLYLPAPWQPVEFKQPIVMYKVMAAQDGQFMSVFDKAVQYLPQRWTHARYGCGKAWPPLWGCMYVYPSKHQARDAVFPGSSQQQHGARVLVKVQAKGKAYTHPDGRAAVSALYMEEVLEYVPNGPAERVVSVVY